MSRHVELSDAPVWSIFELYDLVPLDRPYPFRVGDDLADELNLIGDEVAGYPAERSVGHGDRTVTIRVVHYLVGHLETGSWLIRHSATRTTCGFTDVLHDLQVGGAWPRLPDALIAAADATASPSAFDRYQAYLL